MNKIRFVGGTIPQPDPTNPRFNAWKHNNNIVASLILIVLQWCICAFSFGCIIVLFKTIETRVALPCTFGAIFKFELWMDFCIYVIQISMPSGTSAHCKLICRQTEKKHVLNYCISHVWAGQLEVVNILKALSCFWKIFWFNFSLMEWTLWRENCWTNFFGNKVCNTSPIFNYWQCKSLLLYLLQSDMKMMNIFRFIIGFMYMFELFIEETIEFVLLSYLTSIISLSVS